MWAQYADNHSGVCLIFNREKLDDQIRKQCGDSHLITKGDVAYANRSIVPNLGPGPYAIDVDILDQIGFERYVQDHLLRFVRTLFFEKMTDWRDESEYRWVMFSDRDEDVFIEFKDSLAGIMFGDNTPAEDIDAILRFTDELGISCMASNGIIAALGMISETYDIHRGFGRFFEVSNGKGVSGSQSVWSAVLIFRSTWGIRTAQDVCEGFPKCRGD